MDSIAISHGFRFLYLSASAKTQLESLFNLAEVADRPTRLSFKKNFTRTLSIRKNTNRKENPLREIRGKLESSEGQISQSSDDAKSAKQEEIIALFRRIQSSISKVDPFPTPPKRRSSSNLSRDNYKPSTESVLEVLRQSRNQVKGEPSSKKGVNKVSSRKEILQKEKIEREHQAVADFKITRPPSSFVKKSPIPSLSISREKVVQQSNVTDGAESGSKSIEEMKVSELKEHAKSKGFKGYSKLKKNELIELLRSSGI